MMVAGKGVARQYLMVVCRMTEGEEEEASEG